MICGFCSKEQNFSNLPCTHCKYDWQQKKSSFWEGGKGNRNVTTMNRNDPKKYRDLGKTQSKHSERVGKEGKEKVQKKKENNN